ncbi:SAP domain-containing protein [Streptomyces bottropensis]|uniref:SAP domain-containing protein n=1 Tax=Streptomyces bottropensis TaxID=42235 RepID=UPI0037F5AA9D
MALWVCGGEAGCGTKYAVGLFRCPRCHNDEFYEDGDPVAKISRNGGASTDTAPAPETEAEAVDASVPEPDEPQDAEQQDVTEDMAGPEQTVEVRGEHGPESVDLPHGDSVFPTAAKEEGDEEPESSSEQDYEAWTVEQLKEQLDSRGLPKTGKKDDLVLRLLEDDDTRTSEE